jgi:hypothetical protein
MSMAKEERRAAYGAMWVLALVFGWIEASVVVYLREISLREAALHTTTYLTNLQITLASLPDYVVALEIAREACTLVLLAAAGWLAGRRPADRIGAFVAAFGIWDLTYYAVLRLVSGSPDSLSTWDILFLIPSPWVAPVWAPVTVAALFVLAGSYLFWTADRGRRYRWTDVGVLLASACLTVAAFLVESTAVIDHRVPERFPIWLFWSGVGLGTAWFVRVERRAVPRSERERPWVGVRVRTIVPAHTTASADRGERTVVAGTILDRYEGRDLEGVIDAYREARRRQDALTDDIRAVGARVEELRERLILMGHADLVEQPDGFFH